MTLAESIEAVEGEYGQTKGLFGLMKSGAICLASCSTYWAVVRYGPLSPISALGKVFANRAAYNNSRIARFVRNVNGSSRLTTSQVTNRWAFSIGMALVVYDLQQELREQKLNYTRIYTQPWRFAKKVVGDWQARLDFWASEASKSNGGILPEKLTCNMRNVALTAYAMRRIAIEDPNPKHREFANTMLTLIGDIMSAGVFTTSDGKDIVDYDEVLILEGQPWGVYAVVDVCNSVAAHVRRYYTVSSTQTFEVCLSAWWITITKMAVFGKTITVLQIFSRIQQAVKDVVTIEEESDTSVLGVAGVIYSVAKTSGSVIRRAAELVGFKLQGNFSVPSIKFGEGE